LLKTLSKQNCFSQKITCQSNGQSYLSSTLPYIFCNLNFIAFNTRSAKSNLDFINSLFICNLDIIFLSETWLLSSEVFTLKNFSNLYNVNHSTNMLFRPTSGRPFCGNGIFYKKSLNLLKIDFLNDYIYDWIT
jgi:hypothetical protein